MRLVVDTNVLFTYFWKQSALKELLSKDVVLLSPEYSLAELKKHSGELMKKAGINTEEFKRLRLRLAEHVEFIPLEGYSDKFAELKKNLKEFSENEKTVFLKDADFIALALKENVPLWTNDKRLKRLPFIDVVSTEDIIGLLDA